MGLLLTLVLGGLAGWVASKFMGRDNSLGVVGNVVVGVLGALLANLVIAPLVGVNAVLDEFSLVGFLVAVLGAALLLAIVNLFTRGRVR